MAEALAVYAGAFGRPPYGEGPERAAAYAGRCAGRLLTMDVVDDSKVAAVALSGHPSATPAQALCRSCGFETLLAHFRTQPGQLGHMLMARRPA